MDERIKELESLFAEVGKAHHTAYIETDGFDPEWPIWYAEYLHDKLPPLLEAELTKSELVYLIIHLSKVHELDAPGSKWPRYYARYLAKRYL
jgi:hypothetical protein